MSDDELKTFIFDDLLDYMVETGNTNAVTIDEIADVTGEPISKVKSCMGEMESEGILEHFNEDSEDWYCFTEDTVTRLFDEMEESDWVSPEDVDYDE